MHADSSTQRAHSEAYFSSLRVDFFKKFLDYEVYRATTDIFQKIQIPL